jgi:hypothetical protein
MDVAKYIGLFLLKNNFVYIHGLGLLEIRKRPATYDGNALHAPSYEVTLSPTGSIDDNLANFIATNEQISISKASNSLKEWTLQTRRELQSGKPVAIPSIGRFTEENGRTIFITDESFHHAPPPISTLRVKKPSDEPTYTTNADIPAVKPRYIDPEVDDSPRSISWVKVGIWILLLAGIGFGIYYAIQYIKNQDSTKEPPLIETPMDTMAAAPVVTDTMATGIGADSSQVVTAPPATLNFKVVINTFRDSNAAIKRMNKLKAYGNTVEMVPGDSAKYYVVIPVQNVAPADTTKLLDSLKRVFQPKGVRILQ